MEDFEFITDEEKTVACRRSEIDGIWVHEDEGVIMLKSRDPIYVTTDQARQIMRKL